MEPDSIPTGRDPVDRAHLKDPRDTSHVMYRYAPSQDLRGLLRRFWVPVWSVQPEQEAPQKVLQYPVCLIVISNDYARFYGVVPGLSTTNLAGQGWAGLSERCSHRPRVTSLLGLSTRSLTGTCSWPRSSARPRRDSWIGSGTRWRTTRTT